MLVPSSLQVLSSDIAWSSLDRGSKAAQDLPRIVQMLEEVRATGTALFTQAGFEVLDVTGIMRASLERCLFFQPADTHCTARGYAVIGQAVADDRWPELGRTRAN